jgi:hypothetical protein
MILELGPRQRRLHFLLRYLLLPFAVSMALSAAVDSNRPNVIVILTDDQGHGDLGFHDNPVIRTPRLDRWRVRAPGSPVLCLAGLFAHAIEPAHRSIQLPHRGGGHLHRPFPHASRMKPRWPSCWCGDGLPHRDLREMASRRQLSDAPHRPGFSGGARPQGRRDWSTLRSARRRELFRHRPATQRQTGEDPGVLQRRLHGRGPAIHRGSPTRPFFVWLAFNAPHTPLEVPESYERRYRERNLEPGCVPQSGAADSAGLFAETTAKIYGMVENIDDNVGRCSINSTG